MMIRSGTATARKIDVELKVLDGGRGDDTGTIQMRVYQPNDCGQLSGHAGDV